MATVPMHAPPRYSWFDRLCHRRPGLAIACARLAQQLGRLRHAPSAGWRLVLAGVVGSALVGAVAPAVVFYPSFAAPWLEAEYRTLLAYHEGIVVADRRGPAGGVVPGSLLPVPVSAIAAVPRHQALPVLEVPEAWWRIVVALEDRHLGSWRSVHGIDVGGLARAAGTLGTEGGSSLAMQLVRALRHEVSDPGEPVLAKLPRKLRELRDAPVLYHMLGGAEAAAFRDAIATHLPLVDGMAGAGIGGSVYGLEQAARLLFAKPPAALSDAESAILAAALHRPILVSGPDEWRLERHARTVQRAARGLRLAFVDEPARLEAALVELEQLALVLPEVQVPEALAAVLPQTEPLRTRLAANASERAAWLAQGELVSATGELLEASGPRWADQVAELQFGFDLVANRLFKGEVETLLAKAEAQLDGRLLRGLTHEAADRADVLLVAIDETGQVLAHYNSTARPILHGDSSRRDADGRYDSARETMQIASVGKVLAVLLLAQDEPLDAAYCNRYLQGIRNWDGDTGVRDCRLPGAMVPMERAFGRSLNLPVIEGLKRVSAGQAEVLVAAAGFQMPDNVAPRVAVPLGMVAGSPAGMLQLMLATGLGVDGRPAVAPAVTLLTEVRHRDGGLLEPDRQAVDLSPWLGSDRARQWTRRALSAPLGGDGTLAMLTPMLAGTGIEGHLAKTGTVAMNRQTVARYLVGTFRHDGRRFAWLVHVGGDFARPLGQSIDNQALAPLANALVRQAIAASRQAGG